MLVVDDAKYSAGHPTSFRRGGLLFVEWIWDVGNREYLLDWSGGSRARMQRESGI